MSVKTVGKFIRYKRESLGFSRGFIDTEHHISSGYLANIEGGFNRPSSSMLDKFAKILNVTPGLLLDLMTDEITFEQAVSIDQQLNIEKTGVGEFSIPLPKTFNSEDIKNIQDYIDFIQYKKDQVQTGTKTFGVPSDADILETHLSLPTDKQNQERVNLAKEIENQAKKKRENKQSGDKN